LYSTSSQVPLMHCIAPKSVEESGHAGWWVARGWGKLIGKS